MIEQKNGEQIFEYKFPEFLNDNNEIATSSDDYEILQVLGAGGFSSVLKVKSKINLEIYAMKKVDMNKILNQYKVDRKYFENEVHFLQKLKNPHVCRCYSIFQEENFLYFVMEFMNNGDLNTFYKANKALQQQIPEEKLWEIFYKCLCGLKYIHDQGLIHRDIKLENLFLDDSFNIKIGDFNVSATIDENSAIKFSENNEEKESMISQQTVVGTHGYMAPEVKMNERRSSYYDQKADVYSMGISFFELCYGCKASDPRVKKNQYYNKNIYSKELNNVIDQMIQNDPQRRLNSYEAYSIIKKNFIKNCVKNSCVDAAINCFGNFPNFIEFFCNENNKCIFTNNINNDEDNDNNYKIEIGKSVFNAIQALNKNNIDLIDDCIYEVRKNLANFGLNVKDNEEIDPGKFISFFLNMLSSVLNEKGQVEENDPHELQILSSNFKFNDGQEEIILNKFLSAYNKRQLSLISRNFFNMIKIRRECLNNGCGSYGYYFSLCHFIPFNVNLLTAKCQQKKDLHLKDGFSCLLNDKITLHKEKGIYCDKCKDYTTHQETKNFYLTSKNLIIIFDRGENCNNKTFVNFDEELSLDKKEVERYNGVKYILVGMIQKVENDNKQGEYISHINKGNNNWVNNIDKKNIISFEEAKKKGTVLALFYYSNDNNLILQAQMNTNNNIINNNNCSFIPNTPQNNNMNNNYNPQMFNNNQTGYNQQMYNYNQTMFYNNQMGFNQQMYNYNNQPMFYNNTMVNSNNNMNPNFNPMGNSSNIQSTNSVVMSNNNSMANNNFGGNNMMGMYNNNMGMANNNNNMGNSGYGMGNNNQMNKF